MPTVRVLTDCLLLDELVQYLFFLDPKHKAFCRYVSQFALRAWRVLVQTRKRWL